MPPSWDTVHVNAASPLTVLADICQMEPLDDHTTSTAR